jgi:hypothetical protein
VRTAFVLFACLTFTGGGACGGGGNATPPTPPPPSGTASVPSSDPAPPASASSAPTASTSKKRKRTGPAAPLAHDGTKPKNARPLNPRDKLGRTVFVRADDQCFVEVKTGTEVVDCPAETDDSAFDHCTAQIVLDESGSKCFCVAGGAKPPMPNPTPCPASAKTK